MKKLLCFILVLTVVCIIPVTASAVAFNEKDFATSSCFNFNLEECNVDLSKVEDMPTSVIATSDEMYIVIGDQNEDGKVNVKDATAIQKNLASSGEITTIELRIGDANCDGKLNIRDATAIQKYVANMLTDTQIGTSDCIDETVRVFLNPWKEGLDTEKYWSTPDEVYLVYWYDNEEFDKIAENSWPGTPVEYCEELEMYVAEIPVYAEYFAFLNTRNDTGVHIVPDESDMVLQVINRNMAY